MTTAELLTDFRRAGVELFADAGRLSFRAPAGAVTPSMREAAAARREKLLALLVAPNGWDDANAAAVVTECESVIAAALTSVGLTAPQRSVAEVLYKVVRVHAKKRDPLLWTDKAMLEEQFTRWGVRPSRDQQQSFAPLIPPDQGT
jgi:hypothetical protein